ncbi:MAG: ADOP family duplicated permease [Gemmatimonadaceae bacterium]
MSLWRQLSRGIRGLVDRRAADRDVSDELDHYVHEAAAAHAARGLAPDAARRAALIEIGSATAVREEVRGAGWEASLESFFTDLRYAGRMLRKSPVFSVITILVVSLGTGAVTTIFSATNAMLLRPLPGVANASRLFSIDRKKKSGDEGMSASYRYYEELRDKTRSFDGVAAWDEIPLTVSVGGTGTLAYGNVVTGNYFSVLGVRPELGRFFAAEEDRAPLTHPVMVISDGFWRSTFGADSGVIGRAVEVNGHPFTIIGVVPRAFRSIFIPLKSDAWVPVMMEPQLRPGRVLNNLADNPYRMFARLKAGVTPSAAHQETAALTAAWVASGVEPMPWAKDYTDARLVPLSGLPEDATKAIVGFFSLLLGASALVLLIASVNVAAMLSARAAVRRREMAVRAALGARRGRLVRQLLTESLVLFVLGSAGGIAIAVVCTRALERLPLPDEISLDLSPDYRAIAFALVISLVAGVVFGLAPALQAARADIARRIREDAPSSGVRRTKMSSALIVGQLALSLLLLVAAGLFLRALERGNRIDPGFDASGVSVASLNTESWGYDSTKGRAFYRELRGRLEALPGITAVSFTNSVPLTAQNSSTYITTNDGVGVTPGDAGGSRVRTGFFNVDADYFSVLRMPIVRGDPIGRKDDDRSGRVAVINETFANRVWPNANAVGRTFTYDSSKVTVIGVARDAKYAWLTDARAPFAYFPMAQAWDPREVVLVRSGMAPDRLAIAMQRAVQSIDPGLPRPVVTTLREANSIVLLPQRVAAIVTGALGAIGLLMATVGLYGVISYSVNRRVREIGIRVALGARQADVLGMVVREGMRLAVGGVAIGLVLAVAATRLMSSFLFSVSPLDLLTFVGMSSLFLCIAFVSSYLPARRAASSDPMTALRTD